MTAPNAPLPREIREFFTQRMGHSLILRGPPGTGKTTFALEAIEALSNEMEGMYLPTRISDDALRSSFPWLKESTAEGEDTGTACPPTRRAGLISLRVGARGSLEGMPGKLKVSIGKELADIEEIYRKVEEHLPKRTLLVIDSFDGLAEKVEMASPRLFGAMHKDVVEGLGANLICILENPALDMEYLGDGVVRLGMSEKDGRRWREMELVKLRGCEIQQPRYLYTLKGGRFGLIENWSDTPQNLLRGWVAIPDTDDKVSTGIMDLDRVLGGGLEKGTVVMIEVGKDIPITVMQGIEACLACNFASLGRGVIWLPQRNESGEGSKKRLVRTLGSETFDSLVRILEKTMEVGEAPAFSIKLEGKDASSDLRMAGLRYALQGAGRPLLLLLGFDTLESLYGPQVMDQLSDLLAAVKKAEHVFIGMTCSGSRSASRLKEMSTVHLLVDKIGGAVVAHGKVPFTALNALVPSQRPQGGGIGLVSIV